MKLLEGVDPISNSISSQIAKATDNFNHWLESKIKKHYLHQSITSVIKGANN
jgi:hypothetical protein